MTFRITRTSDWDNKQLPCDGCREVEVSGVCMDNKTIFTEKIYVKDIDTLEELMNFLHTIKEELVLKPECKIYNRLEPAFPEIEIYDTYRE